MDLNAVKRVGKCITNIYSDIETKGQWGQAVVLLNQMNYLQKACVWVELSSNIQKSECTNKNLELYTYKVIFKNLIKDAEHKVESNKECTYNNSNGDESEIKHFESVMRQASITCEHLERTIQVTKQVLYHDIVGSDSRIPRTNLPVGAGSIDTSPTSSLEFSQLTSDMQALQSTQQRDTALLRAAVDKLETSGKNTANAVAVLETRVTVAQTGIQSTVGKVLALEIQDNAIDDKLLQLTTSQERDRAEAGGAKQAAVIAFQKAESAERASTALQASFRDVVKATEAVGGIAKEALQRVITVETTARALDAAVVGLEMKKVDKTRFEETFKTPQYRTSEQDENYTEEQIFNMRHNQGVRASRPPTPGPALPRPPDVAAGPATRAQATGGFRPATRQTTDHAPPGSRLQNPTASSAARSSTSPIRVRGSDVLTNLPMAAHRVVDPTPPLIDEFQEPTRHIVRTIVEPATPFVPGGGDDSKNIHAAPSTSPSGPASGPTLPGSPSA
jgi:hypothetical protein